MQSLVNYHSTRLEQEQSRTGSSAGSNPKWGNRWGRGGAKWGSRGWVTQVSRGRRMSTSMDVSCPLVTSRQEQHFRDVIYELLAPLRLFYLYSPSCIVSRS